MVMEDDEWNSKSKPINSQESSFDEKENPGQSFIINVLTLSCQFEIFNCRIRSHESTTKKLDLDRKSFPWT